MSTDTENVKDVAADEQKPVVANARPKFGPQQRGHGPMGAMGGAAEKAVNFLPSLKRLIGYLGPQKVAVAVVILMAAVGVTFNVLGPKVLGKATDVIFAGVVGKQLPAGVPVQAVIDGLRAKGQGNLADMLTSMHVVPGQGILFDDLFRWLMLAVGLYAVGAILMWANGWILNGVVQKTVYEMRRQVATKLERLPLSYFDKQPRGELLSRVTNDIDNVSQSLQQTLSQLLTSLLTVIGVLIMMLTVSPILTVIAVVSIPVSVGLVAVIGKQSQKRFAAMWKHTGELNGQIEEAFTGHALVKVFGRQQEMNTTFHEKNAELYKAAFGAQFISAIIMPVMFFVGNLSYVLVAVVGGLRVASGQLSLGDVQAFITYSRQFTQPLTQIASMANLLQSGVASAERVFEVLDAEEMSAEATGRLPEAVRGRVSFENLDFSYLPDRPLIENLNLDVQPGQTVAIVGPTGAGKTTLVNLVMRFYELNAGRITLDGVDISSVPRADLRSNLGMVLQDTWLFHGTIRDNIAYGRPDASDEEILAAARATYVDRFVHALPEGYDTVIDEEGSNVSVGEKQLITIARAFLADPALLILDEATSSVDTRTEVLVQKAMGALRKGRTSFVIAHRLSTIRDADVILVMEHGQIVEQGDHAGLLAAQGAYYDLYQSQFSGATTAEEEELPQLAGAGGSRGPRRS
jgi:ATP-binding cassette, subfamily B, multidrug efflux pump